MFKSLETLFFQFPHLFIGLLPTWMELIFIILIIVTS